MYKLNLSSGKTSSQILHKMKKLSHHRTQQNTTTMAAAKVVVKQFLLRFWNNLICRTMNILMIMTVIETVH